MCNTCSGKESSLFTVTCEESMTLAFTCTSCSGEDTSVFTLIFEDPITAMFIAGIELSYFLQTWCTYCRFG